MPYPLPLTRTEAYLAYKAGVIQQSDLKPSLAVPRNGIDAWLAYWTGLAADYPKREDGTPHILQEEEAYIAYLCGVINEYPEKCLRRVGAYLRYLISARWGRPDHPLNREELYLSLIKTQFIPSGDPSSDIVIDGTAKAPFVDVKMYGDTFQQSYSGKNLMALKDSAQEKTGVTITPNSDGSFTLNGTATATTDFYFAGSWSNRTISYLDMPSGDYTISLLDSGKQQISSPKFRVELYDRMGENSSRILWLQQSYPSPQTTTIASPAQLTASYISIPINQSFTNEKFYIQLEKSSTATSFEKYVGGTPSPNPDYPQPIQTVTGEQTITVTGKNLFNAEAIPYVAKRAYTSDGSVVNWTNYTGTDEYQPVEPNTEYTIWNNKARDTTYLCEYDENKNFIRRTVEATTFTTTATTKYLRWSIYVGAGEIPPTQTQLELGATASSFEPYAKHDYPINLGSIELCRIDGYGGSTYRDSIYKNLTDNKWYLHKEVGKYVFNGSEAWTQSSRTTTVMYVGALNIVSLGITANESRNKSLANRAIIITTSVVGSFSIFNASSGVSQFMCYAVSSSYAASLAQFKEKLATDNLIVYAPLATPTDTAITDQNLINQLNALKQGGAENGTTYIKVNATDPNLPGLLYVEAPKYE